jgi:hypothetical protein
MWPFKHLLRTRSSAALWLAAACTAALIALFACNTATDVHESSDAKGRACVSCHVGAFNAASNPLHVARMPQTCQDCHATKGWSPSTIKDHPWWPIQNKHVGVSCTSCHTKGFQKGDTPTDCLGCHRKNYEASQQPKHVLNGVDQYPLECATCHADTGFKPSTWQHPWPLLGRHVITPCKGCHTGTPPVYKGTATECYQCHKADADIRALAKNPNHAAYPHTCLNCHLMSGWAQGPPLSGLHPEDKFPILTGKHSDPQIVCLDCHKLEKGIAGGGANTDCVNCHLGAHVIPAIDAYHLKTPTGGTVAGYPQASPSTNFCLGCHGKGQHL